VIGTRVGQDAQRPGSSGRKGKTLKAITGTGFVGDVSGPIPSGKGGNSHSGGGPHTDGLGPWPPGVGLIKLLGWGPGRPQTRGNVNGRTFADFTGSANRTGFAVVRVNPGESWQERRRAGWGGRANRKVRQVWSIALISGATQRPGILGKVGPQAKTTLIAPGGACTRAVERGPRWNALRGGVHRYSRAMHCPLCAAPRFPGD